jgi:hypothetical protein
VVGSFGLAALGTLGAFCVQRWGTNPTPLRLGNQMSVFGLMFVFSAAVERLLEPFTQWLPGRGSKQRSEQAVAAMANGNGMAPLVSSAGGFYVLRSLAENPQWGVIPRWTDALLNGLVVGSGTKPLHDWVARMRRTKESAGDSAA